MGYFKVVFKPDDVEVVVERGTTILHAAQKANIAIKAACGGGGSCGRCAVIIKDGKVVPGQTGKLSPEQLAEGWVLSCQAVIEDDIIVQIPEESRMSEHQVLISSEKEVQEALAMAKTLSLEGKPLYWKVDLELTPPTLDENTDDCSRLMTEIRKVTGIQNIYMSNLVLRKLASTLRESDWHVSAYLAKTPCGVEIAELLSAQLEWTPYGVAVDIGTTTVAVQLVNMTNNQIVAASGAYNKQAKYGDDVITRIVYAVDEKDGLQTLQKTVMESINTQIAGLVTKVGITHEDIRCVVVAGNTTMTHLFLGIEPTYIRLEPYIPTVNSVPQIKARELALLTNEEAWVHCLPNIASYVGGDISSGVLMTGMSEKDSLTLLIDIGTNGEMVLGNRDWLIACACSAGPAFEGGGIEFGMRAMRGAIERITISDDYEVEVASIGNVPPIGICGSGLIDCIATLRDAGIIDRTGRFITDVGTKRVRMNDEGPEFVLVWAEQAGIDRDIVISENDIKNIVRSKGAIFAGIRVMLSMVDLPVEAIDEILIAGGFGNYINIKDAITIGLLPDLPEDKYRYIGNSSLKGAYLSLISDTAREKVEEIASKMTYLELSVGNKFMDEFVSALFIPHTDLTLFPSVKK